MARLPHITTLMAATDVPCPFHHPGWVYEEKVDGWRVLAYKDAAGVRLISRNGRELTRQFPELAGAVAGLESPTLVGRDEASGYVEGRTLSWLKVKVPHYRKGERGWEPAKK